MFHARQAHAGGRAEHDSNCVPPGPWGGPDETGSGPGSRERPGDAGGLGTRRCTYLKSRMLETPAWSEPQNPSVGYRPVTVDLTRRTWLGLSVITWSTLWSKSATLPPPPAVSTSAFR